MGASRSSYRTPRFRAVLVDGTVLEGTIQGSGGRLGNGASHVGQEAAERAAAVSLVAKVICAGSTRETEIALAETLGLVTSWAWVYLIPTGPAEHGDGEWSERVEVPLLGTRWALLPARSVGCRACDQTGIGAGSGSSCEACSPVITLILTGGSDAR